MDVTLLPRSQNNLAIEQRFNQIENQQQIIRKAEGRMIRPLCRIGCKLTEIRSLARRNWGILPDSVGLSRRAAARLMRISQSWNDGSELAETALPLLPVDLLKLEGISRLSRQQRDGVLETYDLKGLSRAQMRDVIAEALGEERQRPEPQLELSMEQSIERVRNRAHGMVERLCETFPQAADQEWVRQLRTLIADNQTEGDLQTAAMS